MPKDRIVAKRPQSRTEELLNVITHGTGAVLAIAGCVVLIVFSAIKRNWISLMSSIVYGVSMVSLYGCSTLYHAVKNLRAKAVLRVFDLSAIFLLIAGTYTPFLLLGIRGAKGWILFSIIWIAAVVGIIFTASGSAWFEKWSAVYYLAIGWFAVIVMRPLVSTLSLSALLLLLLGGLCYSIGIPFLLSRFRYAHCIWHLFVLGGSALHFCSILPLIA